MMLRLLPVLLWLLGSCAPQVVVETRDAHPRPAPSTGPVLVLRPHEPVLAPARELALIRVRAGLLPILADSASQLRRATAQARQLGANLLRPEAAAAGELQLRAFRVASLQPYEPEISWAPTRPLTPADFKAAAGPGRCEAATHSGIRYRCHSQPWQPTARLTIEAYFDCRHSFFRPTRTPQQTLAHEQLHFDLTEVYARRLTQRLQAAVATTPELTRRHHTIFRQLMAEANARQDQFDREVYARRRRLGAWQQQVAHELQMLRPYATKEVVLQVRDLDAHLQAYAAGIP